MSRSSLLASHGQSGKNLLREGRVQLTSLSTLLSQSRVFFLYADTLVISKYKGRTYKTKEKHWIDRIWVSPTGSSIDSFLIGWPLTNYLVHFPNRRERDEWFSLLSSLINARIKPLSTTITMRIVVRDRKQLIRTTIDNGKTAGEIIVDTQSQLGLPCVSYDLRVQIEDSSEKILQGPENVYCIIMSELEKTGIRLSDSQRSSLDTCPVVNIKLLLCHLRSSRPFHHEVFSSIKRRLSRSESKTVFGRTLEGRTPPQPILSIIDHLRMHCSDVEGLFRKSPKHSTAKELRNELDSGVVPDFHKYNAHVLASTLKDYLRSIPNKLLLNGNYEKWMEVMEKTGDDRVDSIRSLLSLLPAAHSILLVNLLTLLSKVSSCHESLMTSSSLAVCLGPSFLDSSDAESSKKIPELIQFLIENSSQVLPSFSPFTTKQDLDVNSNDICTSPCLKIEECTSPPPVPSSTSIPSSPLPLSPTPPVSSSDSPLHDTTTPLFRSKVLRAEPSIRDKKETTPRSPCLKRIHFNAHLQKGGSSSRPVIVSDSEDEDDDFTWRPLANSTVDVPRKTSFECVRSDEMNRSEVMTPRTKKEKTNGTVKKEEDKRSAVVKREEKETKKEEIRPKEDKPTVQVLPFRAREESDEECSTTVTRTFSHRSNRTRVDLHRTSSVVCQRRPIPSRESIVRDSFPSKEAKDVTVALGLDQLEINWSVAQLKRVFQTSSKVPEIQTNFGL